MVPTIRVSTRSFSWWRRGHVVDNSTIPPVTCGRRTEVCSKATNLLCQWCVMPTELYNYRGRPTTDNACKVSAVMVPLTLRHHVQFGCDPNDVIHFKPSPAATFSPQCPPLPLLQHTDTTQPIVPTPAQGTPDSNALGVPTSQFSERPTTISNRP